MSDQTPRTSPGWGPVLFLCAFLVIGGAFLYEQFRHKGRGSGSGVEYNQDGSIRSVSEDRAAQAVRRLECFNRIEADPSSGTTIDCATLP